MARTLTPAQRRALLWLVRHDGEQSAGRMMIAGHIAPQTIHNLSDALLIRVRYAQVWGSGKRPIESVRLTEAGRAAVATTIPPPACDHDWRQVEMDAQECAQCGATRPAYSGWQPF